MYRTTTILALLIFATSCGSLKKNSQKESREESRELLEVSEVTERERIEIDTIIEVEVPPLVVISETDQPDTTYTERQGRATVNTRIKDGVKVQEIQADPVPTPVKVTKEKERTGKQKTKETTNEIHTTEAEEIDRGSVWNDIKNLVWALVVLAALVFAFLIWRRLKKSP